MASPLRIGVIGTSFVSDWLCEAVRESCGSVISAVCSREPERGRTFAQKQCIGKYFSEEEDFFSCSDIDAVYIASPNLRALPADDGGAGAWQARALRKAVCHQRRAGGADDCACA